MPVPVECPVECQALADEIEALELKIEELSTALDNASTMEKPSLVRKITRLGSLIDVKGIALNACIAQYGGPPPPPPLASSFTGTMSLTTDSHYTGEPFTDQTSWGLLFNVPRTQVFVTTFPAWKIDTTKAAPPIPWPFGGLFDKENITIISKTGGGNGVYSKDDGNVSLPLMLFFDHSRNFFNTDSNLSIVLSTTSPQGSPVTAAGQVTLSGSGVFSGGWLDRVPCKMVVTGILSPVP